jgi:hypothetical protein
MPEVIAFGSEPSQRWQKTIPEGTTIRLGRSPRKRWRVPWDNLISREHAEIALEDQQLHVRCLDTARNSIYFRKNQETEFSLTSGEGFSIGETRFQFVEGEGDITSERADPLQELTFDELPKPMRWPSFVSTYSMRGTGVARRFWNGSNALTITARSSRAAD